MSYWIYLRAGGRRRYNAQRQQKADERRERMAEIVRKIRDKQPLAVLTRGLPGQLAAMFGVHRSTAWRDLTRIIWGSYRCQHCRNGELLFTVVRAYKGGPVVLITMADGTLVFSARERQAILRRWGIGRYNRRRGR